MKYIWKYIKRALSQDNRKKFDGDSNAQYCVVIRFAEVGPDGNDPGGFWCEVKIPRQADNELMMTVSETISSRDEAAAVFRQIADLIDS